VEKLLNEENTWDNAIPVKM